MLQTPPTGHTELAVHVQIFGALGRGVWGASLCLFKDESLFWKFGRQEYDTLIVFLLNILERGFEGGKASLTSVRNCLAMLEATVLENGGLNQIIFLVLHLLGMGVEGGG